MFHFSADTKVEPEGHLIILPARWFGGNGTHFRIALEQNPSPSRVSHTATWFAKNEQP